MEITYQYLKKRSAFGRQPLFCEQGPDMCDSIATDVQEHKNYILRNPVHELIQNTPSFSEDHINTIRAEYSVSGCNHSEGGWPKDINIHDPEATQRYRRKIEKEDGYIHCVNVLNPGMEHYVYQNNAIDMYRTYYVEMEHMGAIERNSCRTINVYRDKLQRPISSICWQPNGHCFAITYTDIDFYRVPKKSTEAYIWNVDNANSPELQFSPSAPMFDLQYSPRDEEILVGGLATGQVTVFDIRDGPEAVNTSPMHVAHRDIVRQLLFINSKSGKEFFSSGPDGVCKWWDLRNLSAPTDEMIIDLVKASSDVPSMATACGVSVLEYEHTIPTRFMVGTENGLVIGGNRKGKTPMEQLPAKFEVHLGCVMSLQRNPAFPKNFLTVGDWTAKIWTEECRDSAVLWTPSFRHRVNCGAWSPTRISMMLLCGADGKIAIWDFLRRQHEPVLTMQVSKDPLLKQSFHEKGSLVAIGNQKGRVTLIELSEHLVYSGPHDKGLFTVALERESKRERILEARLREIKLKQRQAEEGSVAGSLDEADPTIGDRDLNEANTEYMSIVKKELSLM